MLISIELGEVAVFGGAQGRPGGPRGGRYSASGPSRLWLDDDRHSRRPARRVGGIAASARPSTGLPLDHPAVAGTRNSPMPSLEAAAPQRPAARLLDDSPPELRRRICT